MMMWTVLVALMACGGDDAKDEPSVTDADADTDTDTDADADTDADTDTDTLTGHTAAGSGDTGTAPYEGLLPFTGPPPTHLLMISIDTLRRDQFTRYGGTGTMPFLDGLLDDSFALDDHIACSNWTLHSTTCAMTGAYPVTWGYLPARWESGINLPPPGTPMLASFLGDAGFHSVLATSNAVLSSQFNNAVGFDEEFVHPLTRDAPAADVAAGWRQLIDAMPVGQRRYAHLHLMEPHLPYDPPTSYLGELAKLDPLPYDVAEMEGHDRMVADIESGAADAATKALFIEHMRVRYDAESTWLDDQLADIWADLDTSGLLDDTLVVVWTDHGEQFYERDYQAHGWTIYREENDGVLFFWAKNLAAGSHEGPTSAIDMVPTVLQAMGVPTPPSVLGVPVGEAADDRPRFAATANKGGVFQTITTQTHKLHYSWLDPNDPPAAAPYGHGIFVYERSDLAETNDLYDPDDPTTQALWAELLPYIALTEPLGIIGAPVYPEGLPTN